MTLTVSTELTTITCAGCGGIYAISRNYLEEACRRGRFEQCWTCPYCKVWRGYGQTEADRLKKQIADLERSKASLENQRRDAQREADHFRKSRDGIRGALVKERKRIGHGVCPCCHSSFENLRRHMSTKHPNFSAMA